MEIHAKNLLILASAGSGKTFQLGNRIIGLIARGASPSSIAALTFTRKAAGEFADSVLSKLASAATDPGVAATLGRDIQTPDVDFPQLLETTVRGLPEMTFGTMDSFFASVVRGFQYELGLTGGSFDLIEGPRARLLADGLIASILGSALRSEQGDEFLHAFRRATIGREDQGVLSPLRRSVETWHEIYRSRGVDDWESPPIAAFPPEDWEMRKADLAAAALSYTHRIEYSRKGQQEALEEAIRSIAEHTIGSGSLNSPASMVTSLLAAAATDGETMEVRYYKDFAIPNPAADAIRALVRHAAACEAGAAIRRTRAVREIVARFDEQKEAVHRRAGRLGFDDVKYLMGRWARDEDARLRREEVDFRIDARVDHWLLDEFQDTSRADWLALHPLMDEAITREDATTFLVGDKKQAIYAWRGGDVGLFDEIIRNYGTGPDGFKVEPMTESWRSCPEVLGLVNRICGDPATLPGLFGPVANSWLRDWRDHDPAVHLRDVSRAGVSSVEIVGNREERLQRLAEILAESGVGTRRLTCGVLLRSNSLVREVADFLRNQGFDVIEEGSRHPSADNQPGVLVHRLLRWIADPFDTEAAQILRMAPLAILPQEIPASDAWERLTRKVSSIGLAATARDLLHPLRSKLGPFGCRRMDEILCQLDALDATGCGSVREAADWLEHLEIAQSPGVGAVQVMTIHKSKGLGFDIVVIPEVSTDSIPKANLFEIAATDTWLMQSPPQWARRMFPELRHAEDEWAQRQRHEAICGLYVALTRAKRALHVLLDSPPAANAGQPSLSNWILQCTGCSLDSPKLQKGRATWAAKVPVLEPTPAAPAPESAAKDHSLPSQAPLARTRIVSPSSTAHGAHIHRIMQSIAWLDEPSGREPAVHSEMEWLDNPEILQLLSRRGRSIRLLREQPVLFKGTSKPEKGVIDRLHLHQREGTVHRIELIDFKTDRTNQIQILIDRHAAQLERYQSVLRSIHPTAAIERVLVSTHLQSVVRF